MIMMAQIKLGGLWEKNPQNGPTSLSNCPSRQLQVSLKYHFNSRKAME